MQHDLSLLSETDKHRIKLEEIYRKECVEQLSKNASKKSTGRQLWTFINSSFGLWFLSTIVVGLITFGYSSHQRKQQSAVDEIKERRTEQARRDAELVIALLPYVTSQKKSEFKAGLTIMRYLHKDGKLPKELELVVEEMGHVYKSKAAEIATNYKQSHKYSLLSSK